MAMTIETLKIELSADIEDLKRQLKDTQNALDSMNKKAKASQDSLSMLTTALMAKFAYSAIREFVSIGKSAYSMAQDVTESESLFTTSMGRMGAAAREWSENLSQTLGLNAYTLRSQVGTIYNMTRSMGIAEQTAYDLSTGVVELANDMASFYNMSTDEAFSKLSSGLTGEAEPLKRIGILVDENTIKTYAYKNGIAAAGAELTQQQKVLARYYAILGQTGNAQGDLARTIDSPANQMRIMQAQFEQAKIELGYGLIPIIKEVLPYLTALAQGFIEVAQSVFGVRSVLSEGNSAASVYSSQLDSAAESEKTLGTEAEKAGKKIKGTIAGLDELNKLGSGGSGTSDSLLSSDELSFNLPSLDSTGSLSSVFDTAELAEAKETIDAIFTTIGNLKGALLGLVGISLASKIGTWKESFAGLSLAAKGTTKAFLGVGGLIMAFDSMSDYGAEMVKETPNWGNAISSLVTGGAGTVVAGLCIGGPVGAFAAAIANVSGLLWGATKEMEAMRKEMAINSFYDSTGVKLSELADAYKEAWWELDTLSSMNETATTTIENCSKDIGDARENIEPYLEKIQEAGVITEEEAENMANAVKTMVDAMISQLDSRKNQIYNTFKTFATYARKGFEEEFSQVQSAFEEFQAMYNATVNKYQDRVNNLIFKAAEQDSNGNFVGLSSAERTELAENLNKLSNLSVTVTTEEVQFEKSLETILRDIEKNGIDFEDTSSLQTVMNDLSEKAAAYKTVLDNSYNDAIVNLEQLKAQAKVMEEIGAFGSDKSVDLGNGQKGTQTYKDFLEAFKTADELLLSTYNGSIEKLKNQTGSVATAIQQAALTKFTSVESSAKNQWDKMSWWDQFVAIHPEEYVGDSIDDFLNSEIKNLSNLLETYKSNVGVDGKSLYDVASEVFKLMFSQNRGTDLSEMMYAYDNDHWKQNKTAEEALKAVSGYATGGFPEDGLFYANHNELVGKFTNGKTAVANNEQIVEGIKRGVTEAIFEAGGTGDGGNWIIQIVDENGRVKAETIISAAERRNRRDGKTVINVGT